MVTENIRYVGVNDHEIDLFEGQYAVPQGMAYNSYVILDEKIAVMDTVDARFGAQWLENIAAVIGRREPSYLVVQHMEPDHSANIQRFLERYPGAALVGNAKTFVMLDQFFPELPRAARLTVKDGEELCLGAHTLRFLFAPMVHWPEVMVTYDEKDRALFSADGFGKFGALDVDAPWDDEARRYYIGIVGKYGAQVQKLLKAASALDIQIICPLHGPVLRENLGHYLEKYDLWSSYRPEERGVLIACASIYGHTRDAARLLRDELAKLGQKTVLADLARADMAECVAEAFRYDRLVLAGVTYNGDLFPCMRAFLHALTERNYQGRTVAFIENGTWAPASGRLMATALEKCKNLTFKDKVTIKSAMNDASREAIVRLAQDLAE
mgnify:FL=1